MLSIKRDGCPFAICLSTRDESKDDCGAFLTEGLLHMSSPSHVLVIIAIQESGLHKRAEILEYPEFPDKVPLDPDLL
jgi:hypothetical protein